MKLKNWDPTIFINPDNQQLESKSNESEVQILMTLPESWSMDTREQAFKFRKILRHFTIYAPFEGRPFVRAWLEALVPCLVRWTLLSDSNESKVINTLKKFLGAFGQPGIVVCLADKGANILDILKNSAHAVEAIGRGTVERHYWKRLAISSCGGEPGWEQLAKLEDKELSFSQLDYLAEKDLLDGGDWCHILANVVSPKIGNRFEKKITEIFKDNKGWEVKAGPAKTLARCLAKGREYMSEFRNWQTLARWAQFSEKFMSVFQRVPNKPEDFVWNIVDLARCSITVPEAGDVIDAKRIIQKQFSVICVKNGFNSNYRVKGSGYRDLKLLIEVEFNNLELRGIFKSQKKTLICEIQIISQAWLRNKKTTSISYKILRAKTFRDLLYDFAKYGKRTNSNLAIRYPNKTEIIKNGWVNLAKGVDLSNIEQDKLLLTAAEDGWSLAGVNMLQKDFGANIEAKGAGGSTPLMLACMRGRDDLAKRFIELGSNIEHRNKYGNTALHLAANYGKEVCVRILIDAKAQIGVLNEDGYNEVHYALNNARNTGSKKWNRIVQILRGESVTFRRGTRENESTLDELKKAAVKDSLAQYFDDQDVPHPIMTEFLSTPMGVSSLENLLQILWFGGNIKQKAERCGSPLLCAAGYGTCATTRVLLLAGAAVNVRDIYGRTPLHVAVRFATPSQVSLLLGARANVNTKADRGLSPLHSAARWGKYEVMKLLVEAKADLHSVTDTGITPLQAAAQNGNTNIVAELMELGCKTIAKVL